MARTWNAVLARLGVPTGDGRIIDPAGGSSRSLPLPISYQPVSSDGHDGSIVVARMETLRIADGMVTATGTLLDSAPWEMIEQLEAEVIGPSVDLDDIEYVMDAEERLVLTKWRVAGATLVAIPAFADVSFTLDPLPAEPMEETVKAEDMDWMYASATATQVLPPSDWFKRPDLDRLTPITVSDTGRVFGHIAGWETCHVGLPGCVTPPSSMSDYSYFHVADQATQDGLTLPVGTLVAGPRHADAQLAFQAAQAHYDDPDAAVAKVRAGEDEFGIWVAGWIKPDAKDAARETFMSSPVSGDWRRIGGSLELIAVCSVNAPGFPVPKSRVHFANGAQRALIGTFGSQPVTGPEPEVPTYPTKLHVVPLEAVGQTARAKWAWATKKG